MTTRKRSMLLRVSILAAMLALAFGPVRPAHAASARWYGHSGNWSDPTKWDTGSVPGAGDDVTIDAGVVTLDVNASIGNLQLGTAVLTVGKDKVLTVAGGTVLYDSSIYTLPGGTFNIQGDYPMLTATLPGGTDTSVFNNAGTLVKISGVSSSIGIAFNNTGTVNVNSGQLFLFGGGTSSGAWIIPAGGTVGFGSGTYYLAAGTTFSGDGTVYLDSGTLNCNADVGIPNLGMQGGTLNINAAITTSNLSMGGGTLAGTGTLTLTGASYWGASSADSTITCAVNNTNTGVFNIVGFPPAVSPPYHLNYGGILTNAGIVNWQGTVTLTGDATITNQTGGTFNFMGDAAINVSGGGARVFNNYGNVANNGTSTSTSTTNINVGFNNTNTGNVNIYHSTLSLNAGGNSSGAFHVFPPATLGFAGGTYVLSAGAAINNEGNLTIATGTFLIASDTYSQTGGTTTVNGTLTANNGVNIEGGTLRGAGRVAGDVINNAAVSPGASPGSSGTLTITRNYTQNAFGTLNVEIGGANAGAGYDRLAISGSAMLDGTLNVSLINSFNPSVGNSFKIMTFGSGAGDFAVENGLYPANMYLSPIYGADNLTLVATLTPTLTPTLPPPSPPPATPAPSPSPSPSPSPTTPMPSPTPTLTPPPTPTLTPTPSPSPTPSPTPTATPTPTPTPSPSPSPSPNPSPTPSPGPTPTLAPTPGPSPAPVTLRGDVNSDGIVNATDLALVNASFNKRTGDPGFNPAADINGDGIVDIYDLVIAGLDFGRTR